MPVVGVVTAAVFGAFCLAPTPGDIGGCGQPAEDLDPVLFFESKKALDCQQCQSCGLATKACAEACDESRAPATSFPDGCAPLAHDGEVCLRALQAADCGDYTKYQADILPQSPSECQFCPLR